MGGDLYAGGIYTAIDNERAASIARWNGTNWWALGEGLPGIVRSVAAEPGVLYAGGGFHAGNGITNVARWDGHQWSGLADGVSDWQLGELGWYDAAHVRSLARIGNVLYVAGEFWQAGNMAVRNIARWDGDRWSPLKDSDTGVDGMNGIVRVLAVSHGQLYAGGDFKEAGGRMMANIAKWDGFRWSPVGNGNEVTGDFFSSGSVKAIAFDGSRLFMGGFFATPGKGIAFWDGRTWAPLGSGTGAFNGSGSVNTLAIADGQVFVGGYFTSVGGRPASHFAIWHEPRTLATKSSGNQVILSWPKPDTNMFLEVTENLGSVNWSEVSELPAVVGYRLTVTNELSGTQRFYRLRQR